MYSIVETGGFQYKVELGKAYKVPTLDAAVGSELELKSVLLFAGKEVQIGTPVLNDASVKVEVLAHGKYDTIIVYKKKRRTRYERRNGHRQWQHRHWRADNTCRRGRWRRHRPSRHSRCPG